MMKKQILTEIEYQYRRFDRTSKIVLYVILGLTIVFGMLFAFAKSDEAKALLCLCIALCTATIIFTSSQISKKRTSYLQQLRDERNAVLRTGLFKEIYDAYRFDEFEFNLVYDKLLFEEYHNNAIDISVQKNNHEFSIEIGEKSVSIIVDEETDHPFEAEIPLSDIATMEQLYFTINEFINKHSLC